MINTILFDLALFHKHHPMRVRALHALTDDGINVGVIARESRKEATTLLKKADIWLFADLLVVYPECDVGENPWLTAISAFASDTQSTLCVVMPKESWTDAAATNATVVSAQPFDITTENLNSWMGLLND